MYATAVVGLRIAHRRTLSQWTAIDFAAAVAIGAVIGRTAIASGRSHLVGAVALVTLLAAHAAVTYGRMLPWFAELRYVLYETKGELTIVREEDASTPEGRLVRIGLQDAAGYSPDPPPTA